MSTKQEEQEKKEVAAQKRKRDGLLEDLVRDNVLFDLGRPNNLYRVQVTRVGNVKYRVNVFVGSSLTLAKIAHSYFLEADGHGKILSSNPVITRTY